MQDIYSLTMLLSILSFASATFFSPGPNNLMLLSSGLTFGYMQSLPHILGIVIGFPLMVVAVGLGIGTVFSLFPFAYTVLKVIGTAYLLWMSWKIATNKSKPSAKEASAKPFSFVQSALFQWVNPKAWVIAMTATSSFTSAHENMFAQVLVIAVIYMLVAVFSTSLWTLGGFYLKGFIANEKWLRIFNISMAVLILASVLPFMFD